MIKLTRDKISCQNIYGRIPQLVTSMLMSIHVHRRPIFLVRAGKSEPIGPILARTADLHLSENIASLDQMLNSTAERFSSASIKFGEKSFLRRKTRADLPRYNVCLATYLLLLVIAPAPRFKDQVKVMATLHLNYPFCCQSINCPNSYRRMMF